MARSGRLRATATRLVAGLRAAVRPSRPAEVRPDVEYRPRADGRPDPGEVVWAWVPYDEGDGRGKDRPVLVIGRRADSLLGLLLSSQDHEMLASHGLWL